MSTLWTEVIDPATLTGYIRQSLSDYESAKGTLARWLPNREVPDTTVRFRKGQSGLVPEAEYRAFDAEPKLGTGITGRRVSIELPALSQELAIDEYTQLRQRNAPTESFENSILQTTDRIVRAISDRVERMRGVVLETGKATINQEDFVDEDDFGRDPSLTVTASQLWTDPAVDRIGQLEAWADQYQQATGGDEPGTLLMDRRTFRLLAAGNQFRVQLNNGASRAATEQDARDIVSGAGLPEIVIYDRSTYSGRVLSPGKVLFLPPAVETEDWQGTQLGATFWGETLTSSDPNYGLATSETPGIVAGVYRNTKPPMIAQVVADSLNLPVLANANMSLVAKVL